MAEETVVTPTTTPEEFKQRNGIKEGEEFIALTQNGEQVNLFFNANAKMGLVMYQALDDIFPDLLAVFLKKKHKDMQAKAEHKNLIILPNRGLKG